jgi:hypothetical protein
MNEEILKRLEAIEEQNRTIIELLTKKKVSSSIPIKPIEERKQDFKLNCWNNFKDTLTTPIIKEFYEYWSEYSDGGKKMRFEKENVFDLKRRMATWLKFSNKVLHPTGADGTNISN